MFTFNVWPSQLSEEVKKQIKKAVDENICSISHRSSFFSKISEELHQNLRELLNIPSNFHIFYCSSATECMEVVLRNFVIKNSHHFVNGAFSEKFYQIAQEINKEATQTFFERGEGIKIKEIEKSAELICLTHNASSTGVIISEKMMTDFRNKFSDKLIAVDMVSSIGWVFPKIENSDITFFSVQKCFGLPAGLGILIVNETALEKFNLVKKINKDTGSLRSVSTLIKRYPVFQTEETPNILGIYLLKEQTKNFILQWKDQIEKETYQKFDFIKKKIEKNPNLEFFAKEEKILSPTVMVIRADKNYQNRLKERLEQEKIIIANGYGNFKEETFRLANFPSIKLADFEKLFSIIEKV